MKKPVEGSAAEERGESPAFERAEIKSGAEKREAAHKGGKHSRGASGMDRAMSAQADKLHPVGKKK